jgi:hypothetical protein
LDQIRGQLRYVVNVAIGETPFNGEVLAVGPTKVLQMAHKYVCH